MAHFQIYSWFALFLILACQAILMTDGRQLKSMKKQELDHGNEQKATETNGGETLKSQQRPSRSQDDLQVLHAGGVPSAVEDKVTYPLHAPSQSRGTGNSEPETINDFRPTTPGDSPGIGHSFPEKPESVNDFRPTTPGNSPGVGHSFMKHRIDAQSEALSNASGIPQTTAANNNDLRPTGPGHSPGAGHSIHN